VILFVMVLAMRLTFAMVLSNYYRKNLGDLDESNVDSVISSIIWQMVLALAVVAVEATVYWLLKRKFYRMSWVWAHVSLLYFVLMVVPLLYPLGNLILFNYMGSGHAGEWVLMISNVLSTLFWSAVVVAHIFFVLTIVRSLKARKQKEKGTYDPASLLDEFNEPNSGIQS